MQTEGQLSDASRETATLAEEAVWSGWNEVVTGRVGTVHLPEIFLQHPVEIERLPEAGPPQDQTSPKDKETTP